MGTTGNEQEQEAISTESIELEDQVGGGQEVAVNQEPNDQPPAENNQQPSSPDPNVMDDFGLRESAPAAPSQEPEGGKPAEGGGKEEGDKGGDDEETVVDAVKKVVGVEVEGEFPDTEQGIAQYASQAAQKMALELYEHQKNQDPLVSQVIDHVNNGGDPRDLLYKKYPGRDYRQISFKEDDPEFHKQVMLDYFANKGFSEDEARGFISDAEQNSTLVEKARNAHTNLGKAQEEAEKNALEQQRQAKVQHDQQVQQFWNGVKTDLDKRKDIAGIPIAEADKPKFFSYIADTADRTREMSQADLDREKRSYDENLKYDYLQFLEYQKGIDVKKYFEESGETKTIRDLKSRVKKENEKGKETGGKSPEGEGSEAENQSAEDIDVTQTMFG